MFTACASLPGETRPASHAKAPLATTQSFSAALGEWPAAGWWKHYGDPQLDGLIEKALAGSPSIAIADARLRRARSSRDSARGALAPQLSANNAATLQKHSENYLTPREMTPQGWDDYGRSSLDFSWKLDFWGKNRAALAAATSEAVAASADADQARLVLSTGIAAGYAELARLYCALDTAKSSQELRNKTAALFAQRFDNGLETRGSVRQADARRAGGDAEVLSIEEQILLQKNRLAALMGAGPDRGIAIARPRVEFTRAFGLPATLSADLIGRRPDIVAARLRAEAAAKRIHVTRAQFYPNVNLTGFIGLQAAGLEMLKESGSGIGSVGPAISLPIFNGGRLRAQLRGAEAEYAEAVANYDKVLTQALQEVADAAVSLRALGPQLERVDAAVEAAREAWRVQNNRYEGGLATYLEVLSAEDYLLTNLRTQSDLRSRSTSLDVALNRALGGAVLDMTIANVSVLNISGALGLSSIQGMWVITCYAVAEAIKVPLTGWLAARFGAMRVFTTAIAMFGVFSALCGFAPSFEVLVIGRILQGVAGGPLIPLSQTLSSRGWSTAVVRRCARSPPAVSTPSSRCRRWTEWCRVRP